MKLKRVSNCLKLLNWETSVPAGTPLNVWIERLVTRGGERLPTRLAGLERLRWRGHEVLVVMRSGRVAIRLDYTTEHAARRYAAEKVFAWLVAAVRSASA